MSFHFFLMLQLGKIDSDYAKISMTSQINIHSQNFINIIIIIQRQKIEETKYAISNKKKRTLLKYYKKKYFAFSIQKIDSVSQAIL